MRVIYMSFRDIRSTIQIVSCRTRLQVQTSGELPRSAELRVGDDRVEFDESLLPEDRGDIELDTDEYEVEKILFVRSGRKTRYGRIHKQYLVQYRRSTDIHGGSKKSIRTAESCCGSLIEIGLI